MPFVYNNIIPCQATLQLFIWA